MSPIAKNKINKLDIIAVAYLVLMSGTIYFYIFKGSMFIPLYFLFGVFYFIYKKRTKVNVGNTQFLIFWLTYFYVNFFIIAPNHNAFTPAIIIPMISIGSYGIISKMEYSVFKWLLLRIVATLTIISIIHFLLSEMNLIAQNYIELENGYFVMSYLHRYIPGRLSGMFWEPGAYQIILNFTLIIYLKDLANSQISRMEKFMLISIIIASVLTGSTVSYFVLALIIISYIIVTFKNNKFTFNLMFRLLILVCVGIVSIFALWHSSTVQEKLMQEGSENSSYEIRMNDNLALIQMIQEKPVWGWGTSTIEYAKRSKQLDNRTASNGPLAFTAYYGIIIAGIFFLRIYSNIGYLKIGLPKLITFAIMIFLISFENFMMFPLMFALYMRFANEKKLLN